MRLIPPLTFMPPTPVYNPSVRMPHPGSFGIPRHEHVHTGIDLYAPMGTPVHAMEDGLVIRVAWFTGAAIQMPWWMDTMAVYVEGDTGVFCYGEIEPCVTEKQIVKKGDMIGCVIPVLKKWKGRPMSMLHLELYDHGWTDTWGEWKIGAPKPEHLQDPTHIIPSVSYLDYDPFADTAEEWKKLFSKEIS
jgi:hypothetical protein